MGCCLTGHSQIDAGSPTSLDRLQQQTDTKSIKILLLGTSSCGKTTIIKQLQKISNVYNEDTRYELSVYIKELIVNNMKLLCTKSAHGSLEHLRNDILALKPPYDLTEDIVYEIQELYKDNEIQQTLKTLRKRVCFEICENIDYFINKIDDIASDEYIADFEDSVRIYRRTNGYSVTKLLRFVDVFGEYIFEIPDVGGTQSERKKWWNPKLLLHPDLNTIIYVVAISEYDVNYLDIDVFGDDDTTTNRLIESMSVFKKIIKSMVDKYGSTDFVNDKCIILLFNKYDLFQQKIATIPITVSFDNFPKNMIANNPDHVIRFISDQFLHIFKDLDVKLNQPLNIIRTTSIDTDSVNIMFNKIAPHIVSNYNNLEKHMKNNHDDHDFDHPLMLPQNQSLPIHATNVMQQHHIEKPLRLQTVAHSMPVHANSKNQ